MRDPLDEANPHRDEYTAADLWCYRWARDDDDQTAEDFCENGGNPGWVSMYSSVDSDGWLMPGIQAYRDMLEFSLGYYRSAVSSGCSGSFMSLGPMDDDTKRELLKQRSRLRAAYVPPVPQWLADAPPRETRFLPDGTFALLGKPGCGTGLDAVSFEIRQSTTDPALAWQLYSAGGELLRSGNPGEYWWQLFNPDFFTRKSCSPADVYFNEDNDFICMVSMKSHEILDTFYWDGEPCEHWQAREDFDARTMASLCGPEIPLIRAAQETTQPRQPCGWGSGSTNRNDLDAARPIAAGRTPMQSTERYINVRPLDDPDNPYRDAYAQWDRWMLTNHKRLCSEFALNSDYSNNSPPSHTLMNQVAKADDLHLFNDYEFYGMSIDDDGFLIPAGIAEQERLHTDIADPDPLLDHVLDRRYCMFRLDSAGFIPPELFDAYNTALHQVKAQALPPIAQWLVDAAPRSVLFIPTGDIVALIPDSGDDDGTGDEDAVWVRYDAGGADYGSVPPGSEWWELYFTEFRAVIEEMGGPENVDYLERYGTIGLYPKHSDPGVMPRYFSYAGDEQDSRFYSGNMLMFEIIPGKYLAAMRAAQQSVK